MKDYDIKDKDLIEYLQWQNREYINQSDKNGNEAYRNNSDQLILVSDALYNVFELFDEPEAAAQAVSLKGGNNNGYLDKFSKALAYIQVLDNKYPDAKSVERRVLNIIENHANIVAKYDNYSDIIELDPLYAHVIQSAFAAFPVPMFSKGKIDGQHVYEYDRDKYIKLMKDIRLIELIEEKQKFFMEQVIPYADAVRKGTLSDTQAANYYFKYKQHMEKFKELNSCLRPAGYIKKDIERCKTFINNDYRTNYIKGFCEQVDNMIRKNDRFMDKGWPVADMPLLIKITDWYEKLKAMTNQASAAYVAEKAEKAGDILSDITPIYKKLTETTITNANVRKKLLRDFGAAYRKYVEKKGEYNEFIISGPVPSSKKVDDDEFVTYSEYIEERAARIYKDNEFRMVAKKTEDEKVNKLLENAERLYYLQKSNVNKLNVMVHLTELYPRLAEYRFHGDYNGIDRLNEIGIYNNRDINNASVKMEAMISDFLNSYPDDLDGYRQILKDISILKARVALEYGKERKKYYDNVSENDPDRERKIDYIAANAGGTDHRLKVVNDTFSVLFQSEKTQPYAFLIEQLKNKGMNLEDATMGDVIEISV